MQQRRGADRPAPVAPGTTSPIIDPTTYVSGYAVQTISQGPGGTTPGPGDADPGQTPPHRRLRADDPAGVRRSGRGHRLPGPAVQTATSWPTTPTRVAGGGQGRINTEDAEELRRRFSGGPNGAGATSVIEADGIDVEDMGASPGT